MNGVFHIGFPSFGKVNSVGYCCIKVADVLHVLTDLPGRHIGQQAVVKHRCFANGRFNPLIEPGRFKLVENGINSQVKPEYA